MIDRLKALAKDSKPANVCNGYTCLTFDTICPFAPGHSCRSSLSTPFQTITTVDDEQDRHGRLAIEASAKRIASHKDLCRRQHEGPQVFAAGPRDCVGKTLTYTEMRLNVAKTILYSDVQLLPGQEHWASKQRILGLQKGPVDGQVDAGV
ncbi:hypothetical protein MCOR07_003356 [Pyricularia oryzae]|nr:hypothetical protein MCOR32_007114 [Pyricularia oryzae]KAI6564238.1 hypothetical protein MCOR09_007197 [Pyricularia oryzae]KAI6584765.1 hypothetical protein MCOR06_007484 [Pyricularia oryzae]KAI6597882.1 hypothetical protein MCOR12_005575 [Pyricularia oryzae]KAI6624575.1 hypothetical protein MCOR07_003356 [Pyricularia oryzae]